MRVLQVAANALSLAKFALPLMRELRALGLEVECLAGPDGHEETLAGAGFATHPWHMGHTFNPLAISRARRELRSFLDTQPFDVVHTHCSFGGIVANPVAYPRVRHLLYTQHGFFVHDGLGPLSRWAWLEIEKIGLRHAHRVICVSQAERELARSLGVGDPARYTCVPGAGVEVDRFHLATPDWAARRERLRAQWGVDDATPVLLTVSRLTWDKGYREMISAAAELAQAGCPFRFVAAGSGKDEAPIRRAVQRAGMEDLVLLLGWRDDMVDLYAAADVFVFASHREGLPISPIEAMASGLPVVASDLPGCREVLLDGAFGMLYPVGDAAGLAERLQRLLGDRVLRQSLAAGGPARAQEFDLKRVLALQVALYQQWVMQ